jgi:lysophospholipase L1-like esterase/peptidoglycan hydrolase-like protein with peptidoglycan-binding domain
MIGIKKILIEQTLIQLNVLFIGDSQLASPDSFGRDLIRDKVVEGRVVAKPGASTAEMYRFLRDSYDPKYDVVVIMGGGNDSRNASPDRAIQNLSAMYKLAQNGGSVVIAVSNPTKDFTSNPASYPSNELIAKWVSSQQISNFKIDGNKITHNKVYFLQDKVHLNNSGHEAIYDTIIPILKSIANGETEQDEGVLKLQKGLERLGFELGNESKSGVAGSQTKNAVRKLEKVYNKQQRSQSISDTAFGLIRDLISSETVSRIFGVKTDEKPIKTPKSSTASASPEKKMMTFLKNKGLTTSQAAGIVGNLQAESGFDPNIVGDNGTSYGIAQWHKERFTTLKNWSKKNGLKWNTIDAQLEFLWWELNNSESGALSKLKLQNNPEDAAYAFAKYFERPAEIAPVRMANATKIYNMFTADIIKRIA